MVKHIPSGYGNTCCTFNFPLNKPMTKDFDSVDWKNENEQLI